MLYEVSYKNIIKVTLVDCLKLAFMGMPWFIFISPFAFAVVVEESRHIMSILKN